MVRDVAKALLHDVSMLERLYTGPDAKGMSKTMLNVSPYSHETPGLLSHHDGAGFSFFRVLGPVSVPKTTSGIPVERVLPGSVKDRNN